MHDLATFGRVDRLAAKHRVPVLHHAALVNETEQRCERHLIPSRLAQVRMDVRRVNPQRVHAPSLAGAARGQTFADAATQGV